MTIAQGQSIGVFGGSFDPVHLGHIRAAELVLEALELDQVLLVPAGNQWQKVSQTSAQHRLAMLELAIGEHPQFRVSTVDVDRGGATYTVDTLHDIQRQYPGAKLFFILGTDALAGLASWKNPQEALSLAQFVVVTRPGAGLQVPDVASGQVWVLEIPALDLSSTEFREKYGLGLDCTHLVPPSVLSYIRENNLYVEKHNDE